MQNICQWYTDDEVVKALEYATKQHDGQKRWGGEPYITHPIAVVDNLIRYVPKYGNICKICGYLHDVLEDCDITYIDILNEFGSEVAHVLDILTHVKSDITYSEYISNIACSGNMIAIVVKLADLEHNLSSCYKNSKRNKTIITKYEMAKVFLEYVFCMKGDISDEGFYGDEPYGTD